MRSIGRGEFINWLLRNSGYRKESLIDGEVISNSYFLKGMDIEVTMFPAINQIVIQLPFSAIVFTNPNIELADSGLIVSSMERSCFLPEKGIDSAGVCVEKDLISRAMGGGIK